MKLSLFAAFPHELKRILENLKAPRILKGDPFTLFFAQRSPIEIVMAQTGMGACNAEAALSYVAEKHNPDFILSLGFGGALYDGALAGDLVWASKTILIPDRSAKGHMIDSHCSAPHFFEIPGAREIAGRLAAKVNMHEGCVATMGKRMRKQELLQMLPQGLLSPVCDMETFYLARLSMQRSLPFFAIRSITDPADDDIPAGLFSVVDGSGRYSIYKALTLLIGKPGLIPHSIRLGINSERAAQNLWQAVEALIEALGRKAKT